MLIRRSVLASIAASLAFTAAAQSPPPANPPANPPPRPIEPSVRPKAQAEASRAESPPVKPADGAGAVPPRPPRTMDVFTARGGEAPAVIAYLQKQGIKLTSIGAEGGARGYLGEAANGRDQVFYVGSDGDYVAVGLLFRSGGENVTNGQVERMLRRFQEAAKSAKVPESESLKELPKGSPPAPASDLPIVDWFKAQGLSVTPFGSREGGMDAFLVETPGKDGARGVMQPFYVMPDAHYAVAGMLAKRGGHNVTGLQIAEMRMKDKSQEAVDAQPKSSKVVPGVVPPVAPVVSVDEILKSGGKEARVPRPSFPPDERARVPAPTLPAVALSGKPPAAADPYKNKLEKGPLLEALKTTNWFQVGAKDAPVVYMVADPQCPFCHATWQQLKPLVFARKLQVRVVMIAGLRGSYPLAVSILSRKGGNGASVAWLNGEGSVHGVPVLPGPVPGSGDWIKMSKILDVNSNFIKRFAVDRTPFLAYVSKSGDLYTTLGLPSDMGAFLAALT